MSRIILHKATVTAVRGETVNVLSAGKSSRTETPSEPAILRISIVDADGDQVTVELTPATAQTILPMVQLVASAAI